MEDQEEDQEEDSEEDQEAVSVEEAVDVVAEEEEAVAVEEVVAEVEAEILLLSSHTDTQVCLSPEVNWTFW